jgi:arsenate reductase
VVDPSVPAWWVRFVRSKDVEKRTILFLCTGNSARSQMAEGLLRRMAGDRYEVHSAGTAPKGLHPRTVEVMAELDIDLGGHRSKSIDAFLGERFDCVITVCDQAKQQCPVFPGTEVLHWSFEDPAATEGDMQLEAFRRARDQIAGRLQAFVQSDHP